MTGDAIIQPKTHHRRVGAWIPAERNGSSAEGQFQQKQKRTHALGGTQQCLQGPTYIPRFGHPAIRGEMIAPGVVETPSFAANSTDIME